MANPADGRETMIGMTSEGREVARRIVAASDMDLAGALADWSEDDRVRFEALLVRLVRDLDRQVDGDVHRIAGGTWEDAATPWRPGDGP